MMLVLVLYAFAKPNLEIMNNQNLDSWLPDFIPDAAAIRALDYLESKDRCKADSPAGKRCELDKMR